MLANVLRTRLVAAATPSARFASTLDPKIASKMKKFQKDVNKEVYLMGGAGDKILFYLTCAGVAVGSAWSFSILWKMANPPK